MTIYRMTDAKNNAELMVMARDLGYIPDRADKLVLDCTYGQGRFWNEWRPAFNFSTSDIDPGSLAEVHWDFTNIPCVNEMFDCVIFDPPYKLNGTPAMGGPAKSDAGYGVGETQSIAERMKLIFAGIDECYRILMPGGFLLVKCMDQVSSGNVVWQTFEIQDHVRVMLDGDLVDMLHLPGKRAQPPGRNQVHAHANYSTLLVFQRGENA